MATNPNSTRRTVMLCSLAIAFLLVGATAAFATPCLACTSACTQMGVMQGFFTKNADGTYTLIGGTGFQNCGPGSACWSAVQAKCSQMCTACTALQSGPPAGDCTDARCMDVTGATRKGVVTSICTEVCACGTGNFCQNIRIDNGGLLSTQNVACGCP